MCKVNFLWPKHWALLYWLALHNKVELGRGDFTIQLSLNSLLHAFSPATVFHKTSVLKGFMYPQVPSSVVPISQNEEFKNKPMTWINDSLEPDLTQH